VILATTSKVAAAGSGILNILMQTSFQLLWALINTFQIIVHLPLINVDTPANAMRFLEEIQALANMDVIPTGELMEWMFDFTKPWDTTVAPKETSEEELEKLLSEAEEDKTEDEEVQPIPERFQSIGYDSMNLIENIGFLFVLILLFVVILVVLAILKLLSCCWRRAHGYYTSLYE